MCALIFFNKKVFCFIIFQHINRGWKAIAYRILHRQVLCLTIFSSEMSKM